MLNNELAILIKENPTLPLKFLANDCVVEDINGNYLMDMITCDVDTLYLFNGSYIPKIDLVDNLVNDPNFEKKLKKFDGINWEYDWEELLEKEMDKYPHYDCILVELVC